MAEGSLRLVAFGGLGEFGLNALAIECSGRLLVVDAGLMIPPAELPGVDMVVPDFRYLAERADCVEGIVLTHGHEDHIGALPHALAAAPAPVYGGKLTLCLAQRRLRERSIAADLRPIAAGQVIERGPFRIHPIRVAHSVFDSYCVIVETPAGPVAASGDFKLADGGREEERTDVAALAAWGQRGVLALLSDSTNVEWPGHTPGEDAVVPAIEDVFTRASGRVFVTCFATALPRVQRIADIASAHGRRIAFVGKRIAENAEVAAHMGLLRVPPGQVLSPQAAAGLPPDQAAFVLSGSQGEPLSALSLAATGEHRDLDLGKGDVVVHSARVIPGNERAVSRVFDHLCRRGCEVVHGGLARVHVSGHGSRADLADMIRLLRPRHFVPIHGDYRMLVQHARLAVDAGAAAEHVHVLDNGHCLCIDAAGAHLDGSIPVGRTLIDRGGVDEVDEAVVRDRRRLSWNGIVVPVVAIEKGTGHVSSPPAIVTRGLVDADEPSELVENASRLVIETLDARTPEEHRDAELTRERVRLELRRYLKKRTQRRPLVVPVIMEV
jgi:ribonuclease J